ncbi:hypothetical protein bsdcttw_29860 [Anaerocolumna chitinilytica]|uniref:Uncharacterized protein n=2 Tax=Anaerocolumna chitinilytica TaxID=1727145 RepID=A0A7I8DS51_9FIRM|nr:hypothetical protein bsdcttw_29860 [Anaerocolumna chitinilytica]
MRMNPKMKGKERTDSNYFMSYEKVKQNIFYRVVNYEKNIGTLEGKPFLPFFDLAVTFYCLIESKEENIYSIHLTNEHLTHIGINIKTLTDWASENTPRLFPVKINTMEEALGGIVTGTKDINTSLELSESIYVITNDKGINGASCLLYQTAVKYLADQIEANLYILPSSIHEIIALRDNGNMDKAALRRMVAEVNSTQVTEEEFLSNNIYFYNREEEKILEVL